MEYMGNVQYHKGPRYATYTPGRETPVEKEEKNKSNKKQMPSSNAKNDAKASPL